MPASRRARAMIFAPRSWPSRPGFATTTRIFPAIRASLEDGGLAPGAPHVAERVAHLAHRDVGAGAGHDRLHQVRVAFGGTAEVGERPLDRGGVAAGAQCPDTFDLLALERGVDAQDLGLLLLFDLVAVDADDHPLPGLDLGLVAEARFGDLALEEVLLDRRDDAAELRDPLEVLVGLPLQLAGEM